MPRTPRIALMAAGLFLLSTGGAAAQLSADRTETAQSADGLQLRLLQSDEPGVRQEQVEAAPERVWAAVADAYVALRIPGADSDGGRRVVATLNQRLRRVGGRGINAYFECGSGYGSQSAEYDVFVSIATSVDPERGGGSRIRTAVSAHARGPAGSSTIACTSTGELEKLISERIQAGLSQ